MKNYYDFFWREQVGEDFLYVTICPHCDSEAAYYPAVDDDAEGIVCGVCKKITTADVPRGEVEWHFSAFSCPDCGWHIVERRDNEWRCTRCRAWHAGDLQTGPVGPAEYQQQCPTCQEPAIVVVDRDENGRPIAYRCENCEFDFLANRRGDLIEPEGCRACGRITVHQHTHCRYKMGGVGSHEIAPGHRQVYRIVEETATKVKRCAFCGQYYDSDMLPLDENLEPLVVEAPDENKIQKSDDLQIVSAGSKYDNSLQ